MFFTRKTVATPAMTPDRLAEALDGLPEVFVLDDAGNYHYRDDVGIAVQLGYNDDSTLLEAHFTGVPVVQELMPRALDMVNQWNLAARPVRATWAGCPRSCPSRRPTCVPSSPPGSASPTGSWSAGCVAATKGSAPSTTTCGSSSRRWARPGTSGTRASGAQASDTQVTLAGRSRVAGNHSA